MPQQPLSFNQQLGLGAATGILDFGGGVAASAIQASQQRAQQKYSYKLARRFRRSVTTDLRAAGLNPILAASKGFSPGSIPGAPTAPLPSSRLGTAAKEGALLSSQVELNQANAAAQRARIPEIAQNIVRSTTAAGLQNQQRQESAQRTRNLESIGEGLKLMKQFTERANNFIDLVAAKFRQDHGGTEKNELGAFIKDVWDHAAGGPDGDFNEAAGYISRKWDQLSAATKQAIRDFEKATDEGWAAKIADSILEAVGE